MPECDNTSCDDVADLYCSGCSNAPAYDHPPKQIYYCGEGCQSAHWLKHQFYCKVLQQRKKLLRVATLLQAVVEAYEESVLDFEMRKLELREGDESAKLCDDASFGMDAFRDGYIFPMSLLCALAHQLLRAQAITFSIIQSTIGTIPVSGTPHSPEEMGSKFSFRRRHEVLMITLKSGENWVIDFDSKVLIPLVSYLGENRCRDVESRIFDFGSASNDDADDDTDATVSVDEAETELESISGHSSQNWFTQYIKLRIDGNRSFGTKLIKGSNETFRAMLDELYGDVKGLVTACLMDLGGIKAE